MKEIDGKLAALEMAISVLIASHPRQADAQEMMRILASKSLAMAPSGADAWIRGYGDTVGRLAGDLPPG